MSEESSFVIYSVHYINKAVLIQQNNFPVYVKDEIFNSLGGDAAINCSFVK